jgi:hypothetical protein
MFRLVAILITVALMAWLALHFDLIGTKPTSIKTGSGSDTVQVQSPSDVIPRAKDSVQQDANRALQQQQQYNQQLNQ